MDRVRVEFRSEEKPKRVRVEFRSVEKRRESVWRSGRRKQTRLSESVRKSVGKKALILERVWSEVRREKTHLLGSRNN